MVGLLRCYHFTALCAFKGDIRARAICYLWGIVLLHCYIGRPS